MVPVSLCSVSVGCLATYYNNLWTFTICTIHLLSTMNGEFESAKILTMPWELDVRTIPVPQQEVLKVPFTVALEFSIKIHVAD